jgi:hypothetical protein
MDTATIVVIAEKGCALGEPCLLHCLAFPPQMPTATENRGNLDPRRERVKITSKDRVTAWAKWIIPFLLLQA